MTELRFQSPHSHAQNAEERWACAVPEILTEPKRETFYKDEGEILVHEAQQVSAGVQELSISEVA